MAEITCQAKFEGDKEAFCTHLIEMGFKQEGENCFVMYSPVDGSKIVTAKIKSIIKED